MTDDSYQIFVIYSMNLHAMTQKQTLAIQYMAKK